MSSTYLVPLTFFYTKLSGNIILKIICVILTVVISVGVAGDKCGPSVINYKRYLL